MGFSYSVTAASVPQTAVAGAGPPAAVARLTRARWAAAAIVVTAFCLRLGNLGGQSLWYDEAFSLLMARGDFGEIAGRTALDTMPPLYYWLLHVWGVGVAVDFWPRLLSALVGTLCVVLMYPLARQLFDPKAALAGMLITAAAPFQVFYSQEVRMYTLLGVWCLLAGYGFLRGAHTGSRSGWVVFGLATALAMYTHPLGGLPMEKVRERAAAALPQLLKVVREKQS